MRHLIRRLGTVATAIVLPLGVVAAIAPSAGAAGPTVATFTSTQTGTSGQTAQFTVGQSWEMAWSYDCSTQGTTGNFIVTMHAPANDPTFDTGPNELGLSGSGVDYYTDTGTFSLAIISECSWSITVSLQSTPVATTSGYDLVGSDGGVFVFPPGQSGGYYGSLPGIGVSVNDIVGMVPTTNDQGYFLVGRDGGVFAFGNAPFLGSLPGVGVSTTSITGIVPTGDDRGYFLVGNDGGVFAFGNAPFLGSLPSLGITPTTPIVGIAATPSGNGYWLVAGDGTVYAFGAAQALGSAPTGVSPVAAIAGTPDGGGYWIVKQNGNVFSFGDAHNYGSLYASGITPSRPIVGIVHTADDNGYWLIGQDGGVFAYGDAGYVGSLPALGVNVANIVGAVPTSG